MNLKKFISVFVKVSVAYFVSFTSPIIFGVDSLHENFDIPLSGNILVVSKYPATHMWSMQLRKALVERLGNLGLNVPIEYLSTEPEAEYTALKGKIFERINAGLRADRYSAALIIGDDAINHLIKNADIIAPDMPIVALGELELIEKLKTLHPNTTGMFTRSKALQSAKLGMKLIPSVNEVVVIYSDVLNLPNGASQRLHENVKRLKNFPVRLVCAQPHTSAELMKILEELSENALVVFCEWANYTRDNYYSIESFLYDLDSRTKNPYMVVSSKYLGHGALGGYLSLSGKDIDRFCNLFEAACTSKNVSDLIPIEENLEAVIDANVLKSEYIDSALLPENTTLINYIPDFYEEFKFHIFLGVGLICLLLVLLILSIIFYLRLQKLSRLNLILFKHLPLVIYVVDDAGNLLFTHLGEQNEGNSGMLHLKFNSKITDLPVDAASVMRHVRRVLRIKRMQVYGMNFDGNPHVLRMLPIPVSLFGKPTVLCVSQDRSEIEKLRKNENKLERILQKLLDTMEAFF